MRPIVMSIFGQRRRVIEAARLRLATIIIDLARDRHLGPSEVSRTAPRLMRDRRRSRLAVIDFRLGSFAPISQRQW